jgi:tripartite-type tricarboxylate transporter receptor subunit TctC
MTLSRRQALVAIAAPAVAGLRIGGAQAQDLPAGRTIRLVVAFPAGGPTDFVARLLADKLKALLNQNVIVDNRAGANGAIGADHVAKSEPDGTTLFFTTVGAVAITPTMRNDLPYDPLRDFAPIMRVVRNTTLLVVNADNKITSAKELAALGKEKPNAVPFASTGIGSMPHLALELYQSAAGVKFLHVPYRGAAPALTDLLGGQVQALCADTPVLLSQIQSGKLRVLGAASDVRSEILPDVPTLAELGFADTHAENWYGLLAPAKTPPAIVGKIHSAMTTALNDPEVSRKLKVSGATPAATSTQEFAELLKTELARWGRVVREKGIKET